MSKAPGYIVLRPTGKDGSEDVVVECHSENALGWWGYRTTNPFSSGCTWLKSAYELVEDERRELA